MFHHDTQLNSKIMMAQRWLKIMTVELYVQFDLFGAPRKHISYHYFLILLMLAVSDWNNQQTNFHDYQHCTCKIMMAQIRLKM